MPAILLAACGGGGDGGEPAPVPPTIPITGTWTESEPGSGDGMVLALSTQIGVDTPGSLVVVGTGTYAKTASTTGTVSEYGIYTTQGVTFGLTYDDGSIASFDGTVIDSSHIAGTLTRKDGSSSPADFVRG